MLRLCAYLSLAALGAPLMEPPSRRHGRRAAIAGATRATAAALLASSAATAPASARGLRRLPLARGATLSNEYWLLRAGESESVRDGVVRSNPAEKALLDDGLTRRGRCAAFDAASALQRAGVEMPVGGKLRLRLTYPQAG